MTKLNETIGSSSIRSLLQNIPLFMGLPETQLQLLARVAVPRHEPKNKTIVFVGAGTDALFIILRGGVKVLNRDADGREVILSILGAGECFGEMGLIDDAPRSADVVTTEPCDLLMISKADFTRALAENVKRQVELSVGGDRLCFHLLFFLCWIFFFSSGSGSSPSHAPPQPWPVARPVWLDSVTLLV